MITYESKSNNIVVKVDGKISGYIVPIAGGYQYRPKNSNMRGEILGTVIAVKHSLESE